MFCLYNLRLWKHDPSYLLRFIWKWNKLQVINWQICNENSLLKKYKHGWKNSRVVTFLWDFSCIFLVKNSFLSFCTVFTSHESVIILVNDNGNKFCFSARRPQKYIFYLLYNRRLPLKKNLEVFVEVSGINKQKLAWSE